MNIKEIRKKQLDELYKTCLNYYYELLTNEEINLIKNKDENMLPIVRKIWEYELNSNNYIIISWNKYSTLKRNPITFATINLKDNIIPFCNLTEGVIYEINYDALIGALDKDGATLIEDKSMENDYTIGYINDKVINSYNGATKLITPIQLVNSIDNDFKSKHNELILRTDLIKEIGTFSLNDYKRSI